jgi:hypothetical protein
MVILDRGSIFVASDFFLPAPTPQKMLHHDVLPHRARAPAIPAFLARARTLYFGRYFLEFSPPRRWIARMCRRLNKNDTVPACRALLALRFTMRDLICASASVSSTRTSLSQAPATAASARAGQSA